MSRFGERFLVVYSGVLTLVFAATVGIAWFQLKHSLSVEQLDVQRINVREADGTLRLVVSGKDRAPGLIVRGREYPHPDDRKDAGLVFFNDEGTENGGLMFGGERAKDGTKHSMGHLSFDAYEQDQTMVLESVEHGDRKSSRLVFNDQPDYPIMDVIQFAETVKGLPEEERKSRILKYMTERGMPKPRMFIGSGGKDKTVMLGICDPEGHPRIVMKVDADGTPSLQMLDANGHVVGEMPTHG